MKNSRLEYWVRCSLWLTTSFNFVAAYVFSFPTSTIGSLLDIPQEPYSFYTIFSGAMVGLFGFMYAWIALQATIVRPLLVLGACGKSVAVTISFALFCLGKFSGLALFIISGDLLFAGFWFYWLVQSAAHSDV